jgi:hypothetical protein
MDHVARREPVRIRNRRATEFVPHLETSVPFLDPFLSSDLAPTFAAREKKNAWFARKRANETAD